MIDEFLVICVLGMIDAMIAPHVKHTGLSNVVIGACYVYISCICLGWLVVMYIWSVHFIELYTFNFNLEFQIYDKYFLNNIFYENVTKMCITSRQGHTAGYNIFNK